MGAASSRPEPQITRYAMTSASIEFDRLIAIVAKLRAPDGCPWDREQTIDSLKPFILEETYEVLEAIDQHDHPATLRGTG